MTALTVVIANPAKWAAAREDQSIGVVAITSDALARACPGLAVISTHLPSPLRAFLFTLAVVDDLGAILVIAVCFTADLNFISPRTPRAVPRTYGPGPRPWPGNAETHRPHSASRSDVGTARMLDSL